MLKRPGNFADNFSNSFQQIALLKQSQKKNADILLKTLDEWCTIQMNYSRKIQQLSQFIVTIDREHSGMYVLYQQLNETLIMLAIQSKNLALKIQDDIVIQLRQITKKLNLELNISIDAERYSRKILQTKKTSTQKSIFIIKNQVLLEYQTSKRIMEDNQILNVVITNSCESSLQKRLKQSQKTMDAQKQFKLMQFKYKQSVSEYNDYLATHSSLVASILGKFQNQQIQLIRTEHQSILKAQLHLSTKHKTICHEIQRISQGISAFNYNRCLEQTVEKFTNNNTTPNDLTFIVFSPNSNFISQTVRSMAQKTIDVFIQKCKNKQLKQTIQRSIKNHESLAKIQDQSLRNFLMVFSLIISGEDIQKLQQLKTILSNPQNRAYFVACLQQYRLIGKFVMEEKTINNLQKMTMVFLDQCLESKDAYLAKQVMALLFTYFYVSEADPEKQKVYLQQLVKHHPIWEQRDFWQSALLMCIYEERKHIINQNIEEKQHEIQSQRNAIFNQLTCIPHNMVLFGVQEKQAKIFAGKYVKLFNLGARLKDIEVMLKLIQKNIQTASISDSLSKKGSSSSNKSPE